MGRRGHDLLPCFIHGYSRSFSPRCSYCEIASHFTAKRIASKASQNCTADHHSIADDDDETITGFLASLTGNTAHFHTVTPPLSAAVSSADDQSQASARSSPHHAATKDVVLPDVPDFLLLGAECIDEKPSSNKMCNLRQTRC